MVHSMVISQKTMDINILSGKSLCFFGYDNCAFFSYDSPTSAVTKALLQAFLLSFRYKSDARENVRSDTFPYMLLYSVNYKRLDMKSTQEKDENHGNFKKKVIPQMCLSHVDICLQYQIIHALL